MVFETSQRLDKWVEKHGKDCKMYVLWCRIYRLCGLTKYKSYDIIYTNERRNYVSELL